MFQQIKELRQKFEAKYEDKYSDLFEKLESSNEIISEHQRDVNRDMLENKASTSTPFFNKFSSESNSSRHYGFKFEASMTDKDVQPTTKKNLCDITLPEHKFILQMLHRIYIFEQNSFRNKFDKELKEDILKMMTGLHGNNEIAITNCISKHINDQTLHLIPTMPSKSENGPDENKIYRKRNKNVNSTMVIHEVNDMLPGNPLLSGFDAWIHDKPLVNTITIICFLLMIINEGLDLKLTKDYFHWEDYLHVYNSHLNQSIPEKFMTDLGFDTNEASCFISTNSFNCKSDSFWNYWVETINSTCYPKTFMIICNANTNAFKPYSSITATKSESFKLDFISVVNDEGSIQCNMTLEMDTIYQSINQSVRLSDNQISCCQESFVNCNNFSCKIHGLHPGIAFWYSLSILLMVHFIELMSPIATMKVHEGFKYIGGGHMGSMVAFYMGYCCREKIDQALKDERRGVSDLIRLWIKIKYFVVVSLCGLFLPVSTKLFCIIQEIQLFRICATSNIKSSSNCERCNECTSHTCICIFCGYQKSALSDGKYDKYLKKLSENSTNLESISRMIVACFQDTFLSIIQLYLAIPLIIQYHEYTKKQSSTVEAAKTYAVLMLSVASVISSILSIANIMTKSFFGLSVNPYLGSLNLARLTIFVSMAFQVTSRLILLQLFGFTFFEEPSYIPCWLALIVSGHILLVYLLVLSLQWRTVYHKLQNSEDKKRTLFGYLIGTFLSAMASVYKSMNIGIQRLDKHLTNEYSLSDQAVSQNMPFKRCESYERWKVQKNRLKITEDIVVNVVIITEQALMFYFAYDSRFNEKITHILLWVALVLFLLGKIGEILFQCYFVIPPVDEIEDNKRWCGYQQTYIKYKNKIGHSFLFMTLAAIIGVILYYFPTSVWPLGTLFMMLSPFIIMICCPRM